MFCKLIFSISCILDVIIQLSRALVTRSCVSGEGIKGFKSRFYSAQAECGCQIAYRWCQVCIHAPVSCPIISCPCGTVCLIFTQTFVSSAFLIFVLREGRGKTSAVRRWVTYCAEWRLTVFPGTPSCGHTPPNLDASMLTWPRNTGG